LPGLSRTRLASLHDTWSISDARWTPSRHLEHLSCISHAFKPLRPSQTRLASLHAVWTVTDAPQCLHAARTVLYTFRPPRPPRTRLGSLKALWNVFTPPGPAQTRFRPSELSRTPPVSLPPIWDAFRLSELSQTCPARLLSSGPSHTTSRPWTASGTPCKPSGRLDPLRRAFTMSGASRMHLASLPYFWSISDAFTLFGSVSDAFTPSQPDASHHVYAIWTVFDTSRSPNRMPHAVWSISEASCMASRCLVCLRCTFQTCADLDIVLYCSQSVVNPGPSRTLPF
jgi:hypothetical protein